MKLYTEEQVRKAILIGSIHLKAKTIDELVESLTPIELPSDEDMAEEYLKEVSPQDTPAICEYSGLRSVEGYKEDKEETYRIDEEKIDSLMDTLHKIDETPEEKAYRMGWINGYEAGANDKETDTKKGDVNFMYKWIREKSGK